MMKEQNKEFLAGYIFAEIQRIAYKQIKKNPRNINEINDFVLVPKIWFGLNCDKDVNNFIGEGVKFTLLNKISNVQKDLFPKWESIEITCQPYQQYVRFDFTMIRQVPKKLTVEEIEKKLGYKIEIISEKEEVNI